MPRFIFNKLVRDNIVESQLASNAKPTYKTLDLESHKRELITKIIEEANEILTSLPTETASEIADVQQAVDDFILLYNLSASDVRQEQKKKYVKNGSFSRGTFIEYVDLNDSDKWVTYFRENSDRYPEVK